MNEWRDFREGAPTEAVDGTPPPGPGPHIATCDHQDDGETIVREHNDVATLRADLEAARASVAVLEAALTKAAETFEEWAPSMRALGRLPLADACDVAAKFSRAALAGADGKGET